MTTTTQKCLFATALVLVGLVIIAGILFWKPGMPVYSSLLTEADSLLLKGEYPKADSLLAVYDSKHYENETPVARYRQLLSLTSKYVEDNIFPDDFSLIDSLCRYYEDFDTSDKYVRALLFKAELYGQSGDYPEALGVFLEAEKVIGRSSNSIVRGWTYKGLGDLYFLRGMFQEAVPYYKRFNEIVTQCRDTLRMAYSAFSMGRVYTVKGQVDSIIHYYKRAIALASGLPQEANIVPYANHALCDIYIQAEEFDSALTIMPHDQLNDDNWAYWYYGQHHVDSAISCFRNIVGLNGWSCDVEYLSKLAQLEMERGDHEQALRDYEALAMAKDSLAAEAQIEELQKAKSQYQFNTIVKERDMIAHGRRTLQQYAIGISLVTIILLILTQIGR